MEALAQAARVDKNTVTRLEKTGQANLATLDKVLTALGKSLSELDAALAVRGLSDDDRKVLEAYRSITNARARAAFLVLMRTYVQSDA